MIKEKDIFTREWITENTKNILQQYSEGITIRQLHYRLVAIGMTNDTNHYKRVVNAMTLSRWSGDIPFDAFIDRERQPYGKTEYEDTILDNEISVGKQQIENWMNFYKLNKWADQENYIEVWIEKKALQGVFEKPCDTYGVCLCPCKGYPSITFLNDAFQRFERAKDYGKELTILYFGDHDPSGEDIPRSIISNLERMGVEVNIDRVALNPKQIRDMNLPGVPPKEKDTRTKNWSGGEVVECDAIEPRTLANICEKSIRKYFDEDIYDKVKEKEEEEKEEYKRQLKEFVQGI